MTPLRAVAASFRGFDSTGNLLSRSLAEAGAPTLENINSKRALFNARLNTCKQFLLQLFRQLRLGSHLRDDT